MTATGLPFEAQREEPAVWPGCRSEAFAEDLLADAAAPAGPASRLPLLLLAGVPFCGALVGSLLTLLARGA